MAEEAPLSPHLTLACAERYRWARRSDHGHALLALVCLAGLLPSGATLAHDPAALERRLAALVRAYPDHLAAIDGNLLIWRDGARMPIDDLRGPKSSAEAIASADIKDMLRWPYPAGTAATAPRRDADPGRARHAPFFDRMYGDCRKGEVERHLVEVVWLPRKAGQRLRVTRVNGVAERLAAVSLELDALPASFDGYLFPAAGSYACRTIAGTRLPSAHGHGIAIDISLKHAHYWRWSRPGADGSYAWQNSIPSEIVAAFERHGFIWGGRWYHFDTMHFEYRPELIDGR